MNDPHSTPEQALSALAKLIESMHDMLDPAHHKALQILVNNPSMFEGLDHWGKQIATRGRIWGEEPSESGKSLIKILEPKSKVLGIGIGYGRDEKAILEAGHKVTGVDNSIITCLEAQKNLQNHINTGTAHITYGDITSASLKPDFDAAISHRMLHLPKPKEAKKIVASIAHLLTAGGDLVLTARRPDDFKAENMEWVNKGELTARSTIPGQENHVIRFLDKNTLREYLSPYFTGLSFEGIEEPDALDKYHEDGSLVMTQLIKVTGRRKITFDEPEGYDMPEAA